VSGKRRAFIEYWVRLLSSRPRSSLLLLLLLLHLCSLSSSSSCPPLVANRNSTATVVSPV
jgi:hypothetical protein